ncbi:hypothetical protein Mal4_30220 [Maioricimonas rarisocia]|uniref:LPS export ABC transporter periplasmic protein LptC n=1 Tax=Maioricimonas rarisocia TaxID=2528026 RepID=A0A517Z871_9PLAN|nr:hypothetical protein [Maioricimonas rarisocia]QDU38692.1 hypothetical protein Mal4_30220 [Maioricimonas rarisocia]
MKSLIAASLLAVLIVPALWLQAQEDPPPPRDRPAATDDRPRRAASLRPSMSGRQRRDVPSLPADLKSLELEFVVLDEHSLAIVVASGEFSASTDLSSVGGEMHIRIDGDLRSLDGEDRWLLSFEATMHRNDIDNNNDATFTAAGSAVVKLNSKVTLARLPGPDLSVTVRPAREQPSD